MGSVCPKRRANDSNPSGRGFKKKASILFNVLTLSALLLNSKKQRTTQHLVWTDACTHSFNVLPCSWKFKQIMRVTSGADNKSSSLEPHWSGVWLKTGPFEWQRPSEWELAAAAVKHDVYATLLILCRPPHTLALTPEFPFSCGSAVSGPLFIFCIIKLTCLCIPLCSLLVPVVFPAPRPPHLVSHPSSLLPLALWWPLGCLSLWLCLCKAPQTEFLTRKHVSIHQC